MLNTAWNIWFLPLCLLPGLLYAYLLYGKTKHYKFPLWLKRIAFVFRFCVISLLCFLLFRPLIQTKIKKLEKSVIVFGIDNSESIVMNKDSSYYKTLFKEELEKTIDNLSKDYEIETYLIGDSLKSGSETDFSAKSTNISDFFSLVERKYINRNIGALVCLSDGIYNEGNNPFYAAEHVKSPIYTVAMGDTSIQRDLLIAKVQYNKTVYKNNYFPLEILVQSHKLSGKKTKLQVFLENKQVFEEEISISSSDYSKWIRLHFEASDSGYMHYHIKLLALEDECTYVNNNAEALIQVEDERKNVAVVYNFPHPDIAAVKQSFKNNTMYKLECFPAEKFRLGEKSYDLIVLHQLPSRTKPMSELRNYIGKTGIPLMCFTGNFEENQIDLNLGLQIKKEKNIKNDAYPLLNPDFSDFNIPSSLIELLSEMPPLQLPFGQYKISASNSVCLYQKINGIETDYPLLLLQDSPDCKAAILLGEGWWRWRIYNYLVSGNHDAFDGLLNQLFQYLTTKDDKSFFRVKGKTLYSESENVCFDAELYNKNYELLNKPEVKFVLWSDTMKYAYYFDRLRYSYHLDIGNLNAGDYHWEAYVDFQNQKFSKKGHFCVQSIRKESLNLVANHQLLSNISNLNNGKMFYPEQLKLLEREIRKNENIKTLAKYTKKYKNLQNSCLVFVLLFVLLGGEWFLRKWSGNY